MTYTLTQAAEACGVDKTTIRRAMKAGRISGTRNDFGVWLVEPVEVHRIFPPVAANGDATPRPAPADSPAVDALIAELRAVIIDLRSDRDQWRDQAQRRALPKPTAADAAPLTWWGWLRSTA
jgi:hypothetical protein